MNAALKQIFEHKVWIHAIATTIDAKLYKQVGTATPF